MLIVEGGDLVGKSTFVKQAFKVTEREGYSHMPMHLTRPPKDFDYYQDYVDKMSVLSIWDRFHLSTLAYRQHDDHPCSMTPLKYDLVDAMVRLRGGFIVVILAQHDIVKHRFAQRGDQMYDLEHILKVNDAYIDLCQRPYCEVRGETYTHRVDAVIGSPFTDEEVEKVVKRYLRRLDEFVQLGS